MIPDPGLLEMGASEGSEQHPKNALWGQTWKIRSRRDGGHNDMEGKQGLVNKPIILEGRG